MNCDGYVRSFIAVEISTAVREKITRFQQRISKSGVRASWVKPENIHLTLAFLGDIPIKSQSIVSGLMDDVVALYRSFKCEVKGVGYFGRESAPRIIWAGFSGDCEKLLHLQSDLLSRLASTGMHLEDKPFIPHLTIARIKPQHHVYSIVPLLQPYREMSFGSLKVHDLVFCRSELSPVGPSYTEIHRSSFRP
ncbi:MAG: 2'-5' RNA ligase [Lentisphaerae bacterium RIFOXYA12_FULL_48_11]|nr:MAG: 2'-5' RNA ligase [Lentisphaerae bacterium RIFOXYA12_FULL_48_11]